MKIVLSLLLVWVPLTIPLAVAGCGPGAAKPSSAATPVQRAELAEDPPPKRPAPNEAANQEPGPTTAKRSSPRPPDGRVTFDIVSSSPHDGGAFTQGLCLDDGVLFEGTGHYGKSTLRRVNTVTGEVEKVHKLGRRYFGEGICVVGDTIVQLTWKERVAFVYDKTSFEELRQFRYDGEGWGITTDGTHLIMSDGSATLAYRDPKTFEVTNRLPVFVVQRDRAGNERKVPVPQLNELEFIQGEIYANVWQTTSIVIIDPKTGRVRASIDLSPLYDEMPDIKGEWQRLRGTQYVANGIAVDEQTGHLWVTGKWWSKLFEIKLAL